MSRCSPCPVIPAKAGIQLVLISWLVSSAFAASSDVAAKSFRKEFGPVTTIVEISSNQITIGDILECKITVEAQKGVTLISTPNLLDNPGNFVVVDYSSPQLTTLSNGSTRSVSTFRLDSNLPGPYLIPPHEIRFIDGRPGHDRAERIFVTPEIPVEVKGLVDGDAEWEKLKDIRASRRGPLKIPWVVVAVVLGTIAFLFILYRRLVGRATPKTVEPAHIVAEREIESLLRENLIERGEVERFVTRLADILRRYIGKRFHLHAPERTTEEFYEEVRASSALDTAQKESVVLFLRQSDLVKFARDFMDRERASRLLETVRDFVRQTRRLETTEPRAKAA